MNLYFPLPPNPDQVMWFITGSRGHSFHYSINKKMILLLQYHYERSITKVAFLKSARIKIWPTSNAVNFYKKNK